MLGSRFDLVETVNTIAERNGTDRHPEYGLSDLAFGSSDASVEVNAKCVELEREMIEVAVSVHSMNARLQFKCPVCDERMSLRNEETISEFGSLDIKLHKLECTCCGMSTGRIFHPALGYRELHR